MIHVNCLKKLSSVIKKYISEDETEQFIQDLIEVQGTNSSFKLVLNELMKYMKKPD